MKIRDLLEYLGKERFLQLRLPPMIEMIEKPKEEFLPSIEVKWSVGTSKSYRFLVTPKDIKFQKYSTEGARYSGGHPYYLTLPNNWRETMREPPLFAEKEKEALELQKELQRRYSKWECFLQRQETWDEIKRIQLQLRRTGCARSFLSFADQRVLKELQKFNPKIQELQKLKFEN